MLRKRLPCGAETAEALLRAGFGQVLIDWLTLEGAKRWQWVALPEGVTVAEAVDGAQARAWQEEYDYIGAMHYWESIQHHGESPLRKAYGAFKIAEALEKAHPWFH